MSYRNTVWAAFTLVFVLLGARPSIAQEARSFEQLQVLVKPGDKVYVTDAMGNVTKGKIAGLSSSTLRLMVKSSIRDLSQLDVVRIRQWRQDSLKNGALIGAAVGLGVSLSYAISAHDDCHSDNCGLGAAAYVAVNTGVFAAIGVGIDALIPSKQTVYIGGTRSSLNFTKVKLILDRSRKGVSVVLW